MPARPQAVVQSADFNPPQDSARVRLHLSPIEPVSYAYSTYVLVQDSSGVSGLNGPQRAHQGDHLTLSPADFPVDFLPVAASPALLEMATVHATCRWTQAEAPLEASFDLIAGAPSAAVVLPSGTANATLEIAAAEQGGSGTLHLGPLAARPLLLETYSFREYGPHTIHVSCVFQDSTPLLAVDLLPENEPDTTATVTVLALTPAQPAKDWSYVALSPFHAGYHYRVHPQGDDAPPPWSAVQSPFSPLQLQTGGS
jgi:hypothetical protein